LNWLSEQHQNLKSALIGNVFSTEFLVSEQQKSLEIREADLRMF